jgi:hypothetical protein
VACRVVRVDGRSRLPGRDPLSDPPPTVVRIDRRLADTDQLSGSPGRTAAVSSSPVLPHFGYLLVRRHRYKPGLPQGVHPALGHQLRAHFGGCAIRLESACREPGGHVDHMY